MDLFDLYRWGLATVCVVYTLVRTWQVLHQWLGYFRSSRQAKVLGRYVMVQLLRLRFRRFAFDFIQIVVLLALLLYVVRWHTMIG